MADTDADLKKLIRAIVRGDDAAAQLAGARLQNAKKLLGADGENAVS